MAPRSVVIGAVAAAALLASNASGQALQTFTGGSQFAIFYGASTGDVVGWRFTVNQDVYVTHLGAWNNDTVAGFPGMSSPHMVGIWNDTTQALVGPSATVMPTDPLVVGQFRYTAVAPQSITLLAGQQYVIGALYTATDNDNYISSATSATFSADVNYVNSVFPTVGSLGFVFPGSTSPTGFGRFGPNFLYEPVPTPGAAALLGLAGLVGARRRR